MNKIAVLLSTYNGSNYINQQIESIYNQTYADFELYIRDDGSNNNFIVQLKQLQNKYNFHLIEGKNIGFLESFMTLLTLVEDVDLYAFADQDDIWLEDKLKVASEWFDKNGDEEIPQLFHSAYDIIEGNKEVICGHFSFSNNGYDFRRSITENHYSGFSMVINNNLRKKMIKCDWTKIGYHDWWAAMLVQGLGQGYFDQRVMSLHRVHGDNITDFSFSKRLQWLRENCTKESDIRKRAIEFLNCYGEELSDRNYNILKLFCSNRYNLLTAITKCFYPKRWRPMISSEIIIRVMMMFGKV